MLTRFAKVVGMGPESRLELMSLQKRRAIGRTVMSPHQRSLSFCGHVQVLNHRWSRDAAVAFGMMVSHASLPVDSK
jgi:hypothetical protein